MLSHITGCLDRSIKLQSDLLSDHTRGILLFFSTFYRQLEGCCLRQPILNHNSFSDICVCCIVSSRLIRDELITMLLFMSYYQTRVDIPTKSIVSSQKSAGCQGEVIKFVFISLRSGSMQLCRSNTIYFDKVTYIHIFKTGVSKRVCKLKFPPLPCCVTKQQR